MVVRIMDDSHIEVATCVDFADCVLIASLSGEESIASATRLHCTGSSLLDGAVGAIEDKRMTDRRSTIVKRQGGAR